MGSWRVFGNGVENGSEIETQKYGLRRTNKKNAYSKMSGKRSKTKTRMAPKIEPKGLPWALLWPTFEILEGSVEVFFCSFSLGKKCVK